MKIPLTKAKIFVIISKVGVTLIYITPQRCIMNENIVLLLDIYGELLPKSQQTALDLRYNSDLSLGEIAEEMGGISRQSVNDFIKKGKGRLIELEDVLGNAARFREISEELSKVNSELDNVEMTSEHAARIKVSVSKIQQALNN